MPEKPESVPGESLPCRPLLKWAGGKTQLLGEIRARMPARYRRYIEPFVGGGALFFSLRPAGGVIADKNPELINLYRAVSRDVRGIIRQLRQYRNDEEEFYAVRLQNWQAMSPSEAAARTLFLNRTGYNGLYRVNRAGRFNVPFGRYKNPLVVDEEALEAAKALLSDTTILCADFREVLSDIARPGDFLFLDPPYLPVSRYADFRRYTPDPFSLDDHAALADEIERLHARGCHVILTNANHPFVHEAYRAFTVEVLPTRRSISAVGKGRSGEDVVVTVRPGLPVRESRRPGEVSPQVKKFPETRWMGSKHKLLPEILGVLSRFDCETVVDLFAGSGIVGYMMKAEGRRVLSNDHMVLSSTTARALIENGTITLPADEAKALLEPGRPVDRFVEQTFSGLYFSDEINRRIDILRANIRAIEHPVRQAIALTALARACLKKRPRGIFTYVGHRYDDGRRDLRLSFEEQFLEAVDRINGAVFDNGKDNLARNGDALTCPVPDGPSLVYIDPPYYSPLSDNSYVRRYHFVEGLARDWQGVDIEMDTLTRKFRSYPTPFSSRQGASMAFDRLFERFRSSVLVVSYASNARPVLKEMVALMKKYKRHVEVVPVDYRYCFGNQGPAAGKGRNVVQEYLFVGT